MDRRAYIAAFVAILLLILLGRSRIVDVITRAGGFAFEPNSDVETVVLPQVEVHPLPRFKRGPEFWTQTTGLMCNCDAGEYKGQFVVRTIEVPQPPVPHYIYREQPQVTATQPARTWQWFGMNSSFAVWGNRPSQTVRMGSDGRIFLTERTTPSASFVSVDEYTMEGDTIVYGPYRYDPPPPVWLG